jgi:hypothetical protein
MVLEHPAGVDLILAIGKVRVLAVSLRATTGEVLGHAGDRMRAEHFALEAPDVGAHKPRHERRVFSERMHDARPPWLGGEVCHRVKRDVYADSPILAPRHVAELLHRCGVPDSCKTDRLGPAREALRRRRRTRVLAVGMPRVGRDRDRDPEARRCSNLLQLVVPLGVQARRRRSVDVEVTQVLPENRRLSAAHSGAVSLDGNRRMEHQPRLLLERHPAKRSSTR